MRFGCVKGAFRVHGDLAGCRKSAFRVHVGCV